jgi:membrane protease YdiL (CAAX protease family)
VLPTAAGFVALLGPLILGSLGEELGWRGFAQPRLQRRWGALPAAIVVGLIWSAWHLWPVLTPLGASETSATDVVQALVRLVATSVIYAWLYLRTKGALPVVVIAHAAHNLAIELMPTEVLGTALGSLSVAALYAAVAIGVVAVDRTPWRTRARSTVESPTVDSRS